MNKYYKHKGNQHTTEINGKLITVDSNLEEKVIRWLENHGYEDRWRRTPQGLHAAGLNYTPDLELAVEENGMTHRAIVEIKPSMEHLSADVVPRMVGAAKHYFADVLLIYASKENMWYRVDQKTAMTTPYPLPPPGAIPIDKLYEPWKTNAKSVGSHSYTKRVAWETWLLRGVATLLESVLSLAVGSTKPKPRRRKR